VRGVEGRKPHQPVHALLRAQIAIRIFSIHGNGHTFQTGFFSVSTIQDLSLESACIGPAQVHAFQHGGPILRIGSACPGMDGKQGHRHHRTDRTASAVKDRLSKSASSAAISFSSSPRKDSSIQAAKFGPNRADAIGRYATIQLQPANWRPSSWFSARRKSRSKSPAPPLPFRVR